MTEPVPFCVTCPVPLIAPACVNASLRSNINVPLSTMPLVFAIEPLVAPSPMIKVPAAILVAPV